jgi:hypothetical protein
MEPSSDATLSLAQNQRAKKITERVLKRQQGGHRDGLSLQTQAVRVAYSLSL